METVIIIGTLSLGACLAGTTSLLILGSDTPKVLKIFAGIAMVPATICFSIIASYNKQCDECEVKYRKVNVELYERVD